MKQPLICTIIILFSTLLGCCTKDYGDPFYGTFKHEEFESSSTIKLYKPNTYYFESYHMGAFRDSGTFVLSYDTIYFTSLNILKDELDTCVKCKTLTGEKMTYRKNELRYTICSPDPKRSHQCDTVVWKKENK